MDIFGKNKTLELQGQIDDLTEQVGNLQKQCSDYQRTIAGFVNVKASYEEENNKLAKKYESSIAQLKQEIESEKKAVAKRVNMELSSIGVSQFIPEEISQEGFGTMSPEMICNKFISMEESAEKHEFFKKHEKVISQFLKQQKKV